jgi:hypothetical protein
VERNGERAIHEPSTSVAERLVACQPIQGEFFDFYYFERINLWGVENALKTSCAVALNLTGSIQAGVTIWRGNQFKTGVGHHDIPLPSVILIAPRHLSKRLSF